MYTKEEASQARQAFWTAFGRYMQPVPSATGDKTNWINYKTGIRNIYFRMDASKDHAHVAIDITHKDEEERAVFFEKFEQVKTMLHTQLGEEWDWQASFLNQDGNMISSIRRHIDGVNVFKQQDWPAIISFLKPRIMALDAFWQDAKDFFDSSW